MRSVKNNSWICLHCGSENILTAGTWKRIINDDEPVLCSNCNKPIENPQAPVHTGDKIKGSRKFNITFFMISVLMLGLMLYLNRIFSIISYKKDWTHLGYEIFIILFISYVLASGKIREKFKHLAIWAVIFLIFLTGYSYRFELAEIKNRVMMEVIPSKGYQKNPESISFPVSSDGHFYIIAEVNGIPIMFLADTGASHIVLSPGDAAKIGIKKDELRFDRFYETANGNVRGSSIQITDLKIGEIHLKNIGASVNEAETRNSLLGMTFFKRLKSYEVKNDVLTLHYRSSN